MDAHKGENKEESFEMSRSLSFHMENLSGSCLLAFVHVMFDFISVLFVFSK